MRRKRKNKKPVQNVSFHRKITGKRGRKERAGLNEPKRKQTDTEITTGGEAKGGTFPPRARNVGERRVKKPPTRGKAREALIMPSSRRIKRGERKGGNRTHGQTKKEKSETTWCSVGRKSTRELPRGDDVKGEKSQVEIFMTPDQAKRRNEKKGGENKVRERGRTKLLQRGRAGIMAQGCQVQGKPRTAGVASMWGGGGTRNSNVTNNLIFS